MSKMLRVLAAFGLSLSLAACSGVSSPSTQASEDFTGTLDPQGQASKDFSVAKTGEMQVTLQSLSPRPVVGFLALAVGTPLGGVCSPIPGYIVSQAAIGQVYSFPQITKGTYCMLIADGGAILTTQTTFTLHYSHP